MPLLALVSFLLALPAFAPAVQAYQPYGAAYTTPVARRAATPVRRVAASARAMAYATPTPQPAYAPAPGAPTTPRAGAAAPAAVVKPQPALTGVPRYKTWVPTPKPTPVDAKPKPKRRVISYHNLEKPIWAVALKGGFTMPSGDMAKYEDAQPGGGLEGQVTAIPDLTVGFGYTYAAFRYKQEQAAMGAKSNDTHHTFLLRALYRILPYDTVNFSLTGGVGYWMMNRATIQSYDAKENPVVVYKNISGFGFSLGGVLDFAIDEHFGVLVDASYNNVSSQGGTGDNPAYGLFTVGGKYVF